LTKSNLTFQTTWRFRQHILPDVFISSDSIW